jgi:hypothetical protein
MALVDKVWDGNYCAAICVGTLFDVYYYKGFLSSEVFERVLFRYSNKYYFCQNTRNQVFFFDQIIRLVEDRCWYIKTLVLIIWFVRCRIFVVSCSIMLTLYPLNHVVWILPGYDQDNSDWKHIMLMSFLVVMWVGTIVQCATGSDVLRWRSFYATHDIAWRAHYREVFDHGIREVLCCLGRVKYSYVSLWCWVICHWCMIFDQS